MNDIIRNHTLNMEEVKESIVIDNKDFDLIFKSYYKKIYNYIYYRVQCQYTAEDLSSQVFEKIMSKIDTYSKEKSPFEVWIFTIAKNTIRDYYRSSKKYQIISIDGFKDLVSRKKRPDEIVEGKELNNKLLSALDCLNSREKNIISLKFGAELKNIEIAKVLNLTESNVGVILYRSMKKLKEVLKEDI